MKPIVTKKYHSFLVQSSRQRVFEVLCRYPDKEFSLSDLAKEARVAKPHIGLILHEFQKAGIIQIIKLSKIWRIQADLSNWTFVKNKVLYNLNFIYQSGIVELLMEHFGNPKALILFGSFRKGEDISSSDIDIAIESEEEEYKTVTTKELLAFEQAIGRKVQIHLFNRKTVDLNVFNNIANGIVLAGFLEVRP